MPHDPNDLATWANAVTVARVLVSPVLFALIDGPAGSWWALGLWFVLCASDAVDGVLARRYGTTHAGAFLDPLADKVLVLGAMFTLVQRDVFWWLPVALIAVREVVISVYRTVVGARGVSVPATNLAKVKTVFQQFAVGFALCPITALDATWTWTVLLWTAVVLTLVTGFNYLVRSRSRPAEPARPNLRAA